MSLHNILNRKQPSKWDKFIQNPLKHIAALLFINPIPTSPVPIHPIRIVCISDTHNKHQHIPPIPPGDILIHAGDLTNSGTEPELKAALDWLSAHPHTHKIFIAGNHDRVLAEHDAFRRGLQSDYPGLVYLQDEECTVNIRDRALNIFGSPWTPRHGSWPFQYDRIPPGPSSQWNSIPDKTDILVTHGPSAHHLDNEGNGCLALLDKVWSVQPKVHVFGHIHAGRGVERVEWTMGQRVYENVAGREWVRAGVTLWQMVLSLLWRWRTKTKKERGSSETILVNAASITGVWDENKNPAIVVDI